MATGSFPGARFIDPVVLSRIGNLELIAKTVLGIHKFAARQDDPQERGGL